MFQVCACLAAGGYTAGEVVSFGFPRPTGTAFLPALRATYERFGAGSVKQSVPPGFPVATKDDGIDVIAWRDHPDRMPGKLYLLGQCASGVDWRTKSVVDRIEPFHGWFTELPARHYLPSMFIPFTLHPVQRSGHHRIRKPAERTSCSGRRHQPCRGLRLGRQS